MVNICGNRYIFMLLVWKIPSNAFTSSLQICACVCIIQPNINYVKMAGLHLPRVFGTTSPYPTVVIVTIPNQNVCGMLGKS